MWPSEAAHTVADAFAATAYRKCPNVAAPAAAAAAARRCKATPLTPPMGAGLSFSAELSTSAERLWLELQRAARWVEVWGAGCLCKKPVV